MCEDSDGKGQMEPASSPRVRWYLSRPAPPRGFETSGHRILQHTELFGKLQVVIFSQTLFFPVA